MKYTNKKIESKVEETFPYFYRSFFLEFEISTYEHSSEIRVFLLDKKITSNFSQIYVVIDQRAFIIGKKTVEKKTKYHKMKNEK